MNIQESDNTLTQLALDVHRERTSVKLATIDGKIEEVARELMLTLAFEVELRDSGVHTIAYIHAMVLDLEDRLESLRGMRASKLTEMGC